MKINFLVNHVNGGWEPTDTRLGGTEESVVRWAEKLLSRGHEVCVYRNGHLRKSSFKGYYDRYQYKADGDICINVKSSEIEPKEPTLYLTNEVDATRLNLSKYLGVIWPSDWAAENIETNAKKIFVLPHGYDPDTIYLGRKIPKQCFYASSPDRGLETLLRAWPQVYTQHPDARLKITYGAPEYDIPGVDFLGEVDEEAMSQLYKESDIWCHPASGGELYCMTGIKAQAAGCVPVVIPTMALAETVRHGYFSDDKNQYAQTLCDALDDKDGREIIRQKLAKEDYPTWKISTSRLLGIIDSSIC